MSPNSWWQRSTITNKPVRVIRGYKLDSPYAPSEGYRYDGLYTVEKVNQVYEDADVVLTASRPGRNAA